MDNPVYFIQNI